MAEEVKKGEPAKAVVNEKKCGFCGQAHSKEEACFEQVMACNRVTIGRENTVRVGC